MSFADEARQLVPVKGGTCSLGRLLTEASASDRKEYLDALGDSTIPASAIARALKVRGVNLVEQTIARHRRGDCKCPR